MKRIFDSYAYGSGPRDGCWWDTTCDVPAGRAMAGDVRVDVAIVGGGFTGLNAGLHLATKGVETAVLETHFFGWGASGRNGGFCCLGGSKASDDALERYYGRDARLGFNMAEKAAVDHVERLTQVYGIEVDRHSKGETELAHRAKDMDDLKRASEAFAKTYGLDPELIEGKDLAAQGMSGGPFFGALTRPIGFGLNPRKYLAGLVKAAHDAGAHLFDNTQVLGIRRAGDHYVLKTPQGHVRADQVIIATNGYSSDNLPDWLSARYMPSQSTVLVTRPLTPAELSAQGWTSDQMSFDTRNLVHYFRLMPDRRFLFGMRGGILTGAQSEAVARRRTRAHFEKMFPNWASIETDFSWSGMVNLSRHKLPYVGPVPGAAGMWTAMCYHGNGVAMASYSGKMIADFVMGQDTGECPDIMRQPLQKFPFGAARRIVMPPLYLGLKWADTF